MSAWQHLQAKLFEDTSTGGSKFSTLDGLRGIAVLTVFLSHSSGFDQRLAPWLNFRMTGHLGVYLFFTLSGFMLAHGLLGRAHAPVLRFYARRFLRIAPLYYLVVSVTFGFQVAFHVADLCQLRVEGGWVGFARHLLFLQGDSVFWTIAAEFQFYFILPFLCLFLARFQAKAAWTLALVAVGYGLWSALIEWHILDPRFALRLADIAHHSQYFDVFLCGVLAAYVARSDRWCAMISGRRAMAGWVGLAVSVFALGISLVLVAKRFLIFEQGLPDFRHFSLFYGIAFSIVTLCACDGQGLLCTILNHNLLRVIGVTCFSWYLLHFIVINSVNAALGYHWVARLSGGPWSPAEPARFFLSFLLIFILSIVTYLVVEKPFMVLSRTIMRPRLSSPPVPA